MLPNTLRGKEERGETHTTLQQSLNHSKFEPESLFIIQLNGEEQGNFDHFEKKRSTKITQSWLKMKFVDGKDTLNTKAATMKIGCMDRSF